MALSPTEQLAAALTAPTARAVAASLEIDHSLRMGLAALGAEHPARAAFTACFDTFGAIPLAQVLRAFASSRDGSRTDLRPVWSGPTFDGDGDHTTAALANLIDGATTDVFASTYSATNDSPFVHSLWRAIGRGVAVSLLVDSSVKGGATAKLLQRRLAGAQFLTYVPSPPGSYGAQHSKVIIIDSTIAFITSANLSGAAAHRNLEAGVVISDPTFASNLRQRFARLAQTPAVVALAQT